MKQFKTFFVKFITYNFAVLFAGSLAANAEIKVVTTIKPLHSLISNVMDGVGEPSLIIEGSTSPHSFVLKPSHAKMIEQADIIFWIGKDIETFMEKPLESIAKNAKKISFMELTSIEKLKFREENIFDHDDHDDHGHGEKKDHDDHGHGEDKDHDDHGHGEKKDHDDHGHGEHPFEWAGLFDLKSGTYKWSFSKVDGKYADPAMRMVILPAHDIEEVEETAEELLEAESSEMKSDGEILVANNVSYSLNFDESKDMTHFTVNINEDGKYAFFTEHMPFEFESDEHFFKNTSGDDVEPVAQEPEVDHHDHGHGEKKDHDDHGHAEKKDHDDHGHEGHHHGEFDAHIWLDPANAKEMLHEIAHELADLDPANANKYESNANKAIKSIDEMISSVNSSINKDAKFIVFHDAYQYFEKRFGVATAGALTLNTDVLPGAKQISEIQEVIAEKDIKCIFSEPQFNPKIIETIAQDTGIKTGVLDPLGSIFDGGKEQYFTLINDIGNKLKDC